MSSFLNFLKGNDQSSDEPEKEKQSKKKVIKEKSKNVGSSAANNYDALLMATPKGKKSLKTIYPKTFADVEDIIKQIIKKKLIKVSFENLERAMAQRLFDFLCGAVFVMKGSIKKTESMIFEITIDESDDETKEIHEKKV